MLKLAQIAIATLCSSLIDTSQNQLQVILCAFSKNDQEILMAAYKAYLNNSS